MIRKLTGKIDEIETGSVTLAVAGVGYQVFLTDVFLGRLMKKNGDEDVSVFVHTHIREDQFLLYGFENQQELDLFELLISISKVGPKVALNVLTIASPASIKSAVLKNDTSILTKVSGIGKKTAERIVLELQNKIENLQVSETEEKAAQGGQEVLEALMAMGYSAAEAREALKVIPENIKDEGEKIKFALKAMRN